jgi:ATP-dependent DNA ligase
MANTRTRKIYTRAGHEIKTLPHINAALPVDGPEWLHGELYRHGVELNEIQSMIKRGSDEIEFHVFDCVDSGRFGHRAAIIVGTITFTGNKVKRVPTYKIMPEQIKDYYTRYLDAGYEGIIIRLDGHGYEHHRSINVFKMKPGTEVI